jgi:hypothetical protein
MSAAATAIWLSAAAAKTMECLKGSNRQRTSCHENQGTVKTSYGRTGHCDPKDTSSTCG